MITEYSFESLDIDFGAIEAQLQGIDIEQVASEAFRNILTFQDDITGEERTVETVKEELQAFLSNPEIIAMEQFMNQAAVDFARFCNHNHLGANEMGSELQELYNTGMKSHGDHGDHVDHEVHKDKKDNEDEDDEEEFAWVNGKFVKIKKVRNKWSK